jgi:hypothetical protein
MDPHTVLKSVAIAENRVTDEWVKALRQVIADLVDYIQRPAPGLKANNVLLQVGHLVGLTARQFSYVHA